MEGMDVGAGPGIQQGKTTRWDMVLCWAPPTLLVFMFAHLVSIFFFDPCPHGLSSYLLAMITCQLEGADRGTYHVDQQGSLLWFLEFFLSRHYGFTYDHVSASVS